MNEELKIWFRNKINSCYTIREIDEDGYVYVSMVYDKNFIRQRKLARLFGKEIENPTTVNVRLFRYRKTMSEDQFFSNYDEIWIYLFDKLGSYNDVQNFIMDILQEYDKFKLMRAYYFFDKR